MTEAIEPGPRPPGRLLRKDEVSRETGLSRATIDRARRAGTFPEPVRISERNIAWPEATIEQWKATRETVTRAR